jgi:formate hydrogenlyase subunit 3/multisubunit Na+/H+ antiporter MnhD subunit
LRKRRSRHKARVELHAERAAESPWVERLARVGLVAQGVSFGLVAVLAIEVALGKGGKATDREGALKTIADDPVGKPIVILLAIGFGAYALWRLAQVFLGHDVEEPGGKKKWGKRLSSLGKAAIYAALCWAAVSILVGGDSGSNKEQDATAGIMKWPAGRWLVIAIAIGIAIAALWNLYRGVSGRYEKQLKTGQMSAREERWTRRVAVVGLIARAVVFGLISWFFFNAAVDYDPKKARGLDGALRELAHEPYGEVLLGVVAAGLMAYGVFCLIQARYREV